MCPAGVVRTYSGFPAGYSDSVKSRLGFLKPEVCAVCVMERWILPLCLDSQDRCRVQTKGVKEKLQFGRRIN